MWVFESRLSRSDQSRPQLWLTLFALVVGLFGAVASTTHPKVVARAERTISAGAPIAVSTDRRAPPRIGQILASSHIQ